MFGDQANLLVAGASVGSELIAVAAVVAQCASHAMFVAVIETNWCAVFVFLAHAIFPVSALLAGTAPLSFAV